VRSNYSTRERGDEFLDDRRIQLLSRPLPWNFLTALRKLIKIDDKIDDSYVTLIPPTKDTTPSLFFVPRLSRITDTLLYGQLSRIAVLVAVIAIGGQKLSAQNDGGLLSTSNARL
jgi:hypothetical protein